MKKWCDLSATAVLLFASIVFIVWNVTLVSAIDDICQMHSSADNDSYWSVLYFNNRSMLVTHNLDFYFNSL